MAIEWEAAGDLEDAGVPFHADGTYLYTRWSGVPARITKIRLADMSVVGTAVLERADGRLDVAVVDGPYALLATGQGSWEYGPPRIVGIRLSDLRRVGHHELQTESAAWFYAGVAVDGHGYFATGDRLLKVRSSDLALVGTLEFPSGSRITFNASAFTDGTHGYFAGYGPRVVKVHLEDLRLVRTRSLGPAVAGLRSRSAVADGEYGYFAYSWPFRGDERPSRILRVRLSDLEVRDVVTLDQYDTELQGVATDGRHLYVGTGPGTVVRLAMRPLQRIDGLPLGSGRYGVRTVVVDDDDLFVGGWGFLLRIAAPTPSSSEEADPAPVAAPDPSAGPGTVRTGEVVGLLVAVLVLATVAGARRSASDGVEASDRGPDPAGPVGHAR